MYSLMSWRDGDDPRIFGGLKFLITGFFWVGKFGKHVFGWFDLRRVFFFLFLHIQNNLKLQSFCVMLFMKQNMFMSVPRVVRIQRARKFGMWFFFCGDNFCPGIFCLVLLKTLGIYLGFDFCPRPFDHPRHLKSCVSPWGLDSSIEDTNYKKRFASKVS